jgi:Arc/MetJ-type ribon-helix-helix transcriptional regulator
MNALQKGYDYSSLDDETRTSVIRHAEAIKFRTQRVVEDIIEIGKSLVEVKAQLPHGAFGNWLKSEFDWSEDTASNFMNVSKRFPQIPNGSEFAPKALYLLSARKVPDEVREEALRVAQNGEKITPERAKMLIAQYENLQKRDNQIPNRSEFEDSKPIEIRLTPQDRKDIQILIESGEKATKAEEIITALRHVKRKAAQEIRSKRKKDISPLRFTTKIKEPLRSLDNIAKQKGETLEEFLHEIVRNYKKRYK